MHSTPTYSYLEKALLQKQKRKDQTRRENCAFVACTPRHPKKAHKQRRPPIFVLQAEAEGYVLLLHQHFFFTLLFGDKQRLDLYTFSSSSSSSITQID